MKKKSSVFAHGMTEAQVIELWGQPAEKVKVGLSKNNYPVEVWTYHQKALALLRKEEYCVLIFVDGELYNWAINEPDFIFQELVKLGTLKPGATDFTRSQDQKSMQDAANQAEQTRKMMEVIRTYNFFQNTQRDMQTMQDIKTMQNIRNMQQQRPLLPPPPPQSPARPLRQN
ncbi:MAG: hypothetical protein V1739_07730 [Candidatus Omnitrophota bacterium]